VTMATMDPWNMFSSIMREVFSLIPLLSLGFKKNFSFF
jgi:hypothetical protein